MGPGKWVELRVTRVVQLFLHLRLNYYEAKIQMLSVFSWKPAQPRFLMQNKNLSLFFLRAYNTRRFTRSKAEIVAENLTDPIYKILKMSTPYKKATLYLF